MRIRINRALLTATAAGATITTLGFIAMGSATAAPRYFSPSGGTPIGTNANCTESGTHGPLPSDNCATSGYIASGRDFRYAQATINIPDATAVKGTEPTMYVALDGSGTATWQFTRVGIAPCTLSSTAYLVPGQATATTCPTSGSGWVAFAATEDAGSAPTVTTYDIGTANPGDGVFVSVYLVPTGNSVHTVITLPSGTTYNNTEAVTGPVYDQAEALADWGQAIANGGTVPLPAAPSAKSRILQFFQGRFTTQSGTAGTFSDGSAWKVNATEATSNGTLPNSGTLIGQPSYLWNDGSGYKGMGDDAFGVWLYPF